MLRRAENCQVLFHPGFFHIRGKVNFYVGKKVYFLGKMRKALFLQEYSAVVSTATAIATIGDRRYWQFRDRFYWDNDGLTASEVNALLVTRFQRERAQVERAEAMVSQGFVNSGTQRGDIPDDLKQFVWMRDGGQCRNCSATSELQFDHVIPVTLGGATSADNLQILCGPCNRRKGSRLSV